VGRFELADGGTLFLDEIANITPSQQARLLRVLQTGEFERVGSSRTIKTDVRILSATNADLQTEVLAGKFRADLLYRFNSIHIHLPPLRERREDIPYFAACFLARFTAKYRRQVKGFEANAMQTLLEHEWPGNVRELEHAIERAILMSRTETIQPRDFGFHSGSRPPRLESLSLEEVEALLVKKAMEKHDGNVSRAARALGLSRSALYRRLDRNGAL
jgi:DNA-binding NtrC family response regulator